MKMDEIPRILEATALPGYRLHLRFHDGTEGDADLTKLVAFHGTFAPFNQPGKFEEVAVHPDWETVHWPWGADLDPLLLYSHVTGIPVEDFLESTGEGAGSKQDTHAMVKFAASAQVLIAMEGVLETVYAARVRPDYWMLVIQHLHKVLLHLMAAMRDGAVALEGKNGAPSLSTLFASLKSHGQFPPLLVQDDYEASVAELERLHAKLMNPLPEDWQEPLACLRKATSGALAIAEVLLQNVPGSDQLGTAVREVADTSAEPPGAACSGWLDRTTQKELMKLVRTARETLAQAIPGVPVG